MVDTNEEELILTYKICVFGDIGVGKTTLIDRYLTNEFHENIRSTLGAAIHIKLLDIVNGKVTLQVWDFGGEYKFRFLIPTYAQGSSGGIFVFDLTNYKSLINIIKWLPEVKKVAGDMPILMVGSKLDLNEQRVCDKEKALNLMELHKLQTYIECSSKTGENVETIFSFLLREILDQKGYTNIKLK